MGLRLCFRPHIKYNIFYFYNIFIVNVEKVRAIGDGLWIYFSYLLFGGRFDEMRAEISLEIEITELNIFWFKKTI